MFEKAAEGLQEAISNPGNAPASGESAGGGDLAPDTGAQNDAQAELLDLAKVDKFKFQDKEWTAKDLEKAILRQQDYTRKTQSFAQERKFYDNLAYDLANVVRNPQLVAQFKQVYPEKFHKFLDEAFSDFVKTPEAKQQPGQQQNAQNVPPELLQRFQQVERQLFEQNVKAAEAEINSVCERMGSKYPYADESSVIAKAEYLIQQGKQLTEKAWENLYKAEHERVSAKAKQFYEDQVKAQKSAQTKAKDTGKGGAAPSSAPKRMTFKEATAQAIADLGGRG